MTVTNNLSIGILQATFFRLYIAIDRLQTTLSRLFTIFSIFSIVTCDNNTSIVNNSFATVTTSNLSIIYSYLYVQLLLSILSPRRPVTTHRTQSNSNNSIFRSSSFVEWLSSRCIILKKHCNHMEYRSGTFSVRFYRLNYHGIEI